MRRPFQAHPPAIKSVKLTAAIFVRVVAPWVGLTSSLEIPDEIQTGTHDNRFRRFFSPIRIACAQSVGAGRAYCPLARLAGGGGAEFALGLRRVPVGHAMVQQHGLRLRLVCAAALDRKSTRLNSSHRCISYAVF